MPGNKSRRIPLDLRGLSGREDIFRLSGAVKHDPAIDVWFDHDPAELRSIAREWFDRMRQCGDDVRELMHDGYPTACIKNAPFGYVNTFRSHVNVGFFRGADIADPQGLLQGTGRFMRHVKIRPDQAVDARGLTKLIETAYTDMRRRLQAE